MGIQSLQGFLGLGNFGITGLECLESQGFGVEAVDLGDV